MQITTNNQARDLLGFCDLSEADQKYARDIYDYLKEDGELDSYFGFFFYRGQLHCLGEYLRTSIEGWDGACSDTFFSGTLIKTCDDDCERVIVGRYSC